MEFRTKRDLYFMSVLADFESSFDEGHSIYLDEKTYLQIIRFYEEELQYDKALDTVNLAISQFNFRSEFFLIKARLLFQNNNLEEALRILNQAAKISPYEHEIQLLKVKILAFQGNTDEASTLLQHMKSYVNSKDVSDIYLCESYIHDSNQDYDLMYESLTKSIVSDMSNQEAFERLGFAVQISKNYQASIEFHKMVLNEDPFAFLAWYNLGHAYSNIGEYEHAIAALEYSFICEDNFENGYLDCADICMQEGRYAKASHIYDSYVEKFGLDEEVLLNHTKCMYELGEYKKSKILLNKLLKLDPYNDEVYYLMGLIHTKTKNLNKAITAFHKALALDDTSEDYFHALAIAYREAGSFDKAEKYFEDSIQLGPEQITYWRDYLSFLLKMRKANRALDILNISESFTVGADLTFCKGLAFYQLGNIEKAYECFENGLKDDFDSHNLIFDIEPELAIDANLQSMVEYYKFER